MPLEESNRDETLTLSQWQHIAMNHFAELSQAKKSSNLHLFALEHGLSSQSIQIIFDLLAKDHHSYGVNRSLWLLWVIYSTEIGYSYTGEEFWQSFEQRLRNWDFHQRDDIRLAFKEFQRRFLGITPQGAWAKQFSIISLPITHAVLPKDLQFHFAKLLYDTRYQLKSIALQNPLIVGKTLSKYSYTTTSKRFQNFLQQEELVGKIAIALLAQNSSDTISQEIYAPTLQRIVHDLEQERNAKQWVHETRRELKPRIVGAFSNNGNLKASAIIRDRNPKSKIIPRPKLQLYQEADSKWSITIEIPKLLDVLDDVSTIHILKNTRFQIPCNKSGWIPVESILSQPMKKRLHTWPVIGEIIKFENNNELIHSLINKEFKLSEGPWLFRVGHDGIATEIEGKTLRPGKRYILLDSKNNFDITNSKDISVTCENISAKEFEVPLNISDELDKKYQQFGLRVYKTLTVAPVGLPAKSWDGEGISEWFSTDAPTFALTYNYPLDNVTVELGSDVLKLPSKQPGEVSYFKVDPLPVGRHVLIIRSSSSSFPTIEGIILLDVVEPIGWTPGYTLHNGLTAFLNPNNDILDAFLNGATELLIYGPQNRTISIKIDLLLANQILESFSSTNLTLPVTPEKIREFRSQVSKLNNLALADHARLTVSCEEIGSKEFNLIRNVNPFRWIYQNVDTIPYLRLVDETDDQEETDIKFYNILTPDKAEDISTNKYLTRMNIKDQNGLFLAKKPNYHDAIVISQPQRNSKAFQALSVSPVLNNNATFNLVDHLKLIQVWVTSRSAGFPANLHIEKVVELLTQKLYANLCGIVWSREEINFLNNLDFPNAIKLFSNQLRNRSLRDVTSFRFIGKVEQKIEISEELEWFIEACKRCDLSHDKDLIKLTLDFASNPISFLESDVYRLGPIAANAEILRTSRFFILGLSRLADPFRNFPLLFSARYDNAK